MKKERIKAMCVYIHLCIYTYAIKIYTCIHMHMHICTYICACAIFIHIYRDIFIYKIYVFIWACIYMYLLFRFQVPVGIYIPVGVYMYKYCLPFLSLNEKLFSELYFFLHPSHNGIIPFFITQLSYTQPFWCNFQCYDDKKLCFFLKE